jgi:hypothetical protein
MVFKPKYRQRITRGGITIIFVVGRGGDNYRPLVYYLTFLYATIVSSFEKLKNRQAENYLCKFPTNYPA